MPSLDSITFDTTGLIPQGDINGVRVWLTSDGDSVSLYYFPMVPDILADINSLESVSTFYGNMIAEAKNITGISIGTMDIDSCKFVKMIIKAPQQPSGMSYLGSLTLPFRDFSFVVKMQCSERGLTGMRESLIVDELLEKGEIRIDKSGKFEGWARTSVLPHSASWIINKAEAVEYDGRFPNHPLSILRRTFDQIESSIKVSEEVKKEPKFSYPKNGG
jgi:hypothetical protein